MERLSFNSKVGYNATEAAIHLARYQLAAPFCAGKRVLDIACGEGYGSYAMRQRFGAASVVGIDNVAAAVETARKLFASDGIEYLVGDAERIDEQLPAASFDVVVSLETIEHLENPQAFLQAIRRVAKPDAVIIISCPNDRWYYPSQDQGNPFHSHTYSFEEFRKLTTSVLGGGVWGYGVPMVGFGNVTDDDVASRDPLLGQTTMLDFAEQAAAITVPKRQNAQVDARNCSYFIGLWGAPSTRLRTSAMMPISMDQYVKVVSWESSDASPARIAELEAEVANLTQQLVSTEEDVGMTTAEYSELATALSELANQKEFELGTLASKLIDLRKSTVQEVERLKEALALKARESDSHRIRALALSKELDLVMEQIAILRADLGRLKSDPHSAVTLLMEQNQTLERRLAAMMEAPTAPELALTTRLKIAGKARIVSAGRAAKPYLPPRAKSLAARIARRLNL